MQERHSNRDQYFREQDYTTGKYVIPFISQFKKIDKNSSILEIGCGEGGNLVPFMKMECQDIIGIDLSEPKIQDAQHYFSKYGDEAKNVKFFCADIYDMSPKSLGT